MHLCIPCCGTDKSVPYESIGRLCREIATSLRTWE